MKAAFFDCFSGASGDMLLGSLLDAGLAEDDLRADLARLEVGGYRLEVEQVTRQGLSGTHLRVRLADEARPARTLPAIRAIVEGSDLPAAVKARSLLVFERIARAEAGVHGTTVEEVHFHEIGAVDSLVDVVGFAAGLARLGVKAVYSSPLPLGSGSVQTEHGRLPAPAPATLALLAEAGAPTVPGRAQTEMVTPTGAALLAEFATFERPAMNLQAVGYGFGSKEFDWPNALRVWLGEQATTGLTQDEEQVVWLACNVDDATGELLGYVQERLLAAGALDAWFTPIQMKKSRPATQLSVLARPQDAGRLADLLLRETPTLGVRHQAMGRTTAGRGVRQVETPWGEVRVKLKYLAGQVVSASPEHDDCARLAEAAGLPLGRVADAARQAAAPLLFPQAGPGSG